MEHVESRQPGPLHHAEPRFWLALSVVRSLNVLATFTVLIASLQSQFAQPATLRVLTTAREVHQLSAADAARRFPVRLRAIAIYVDSTFPILWVQDKTAGTFVELRAGAAVAPARAGDLIEVTGISASGEFAPCVHEGQVRVLGAGWRLEPQRPNYADLMAGRYQSEYVEIEGRVHSGKISDSYLLLNVHTAEPGWRADPPGKHSDVCRLQSHRLLDQECDWMTPSTLVTHSLPGRANHERWREQEPAGALPRRASRHCQ